MRAYNGQIRHEPYHKHVLVLARTVVRHEQQSALVNPLFKHIVIYHAANGIDALVSRLMSAVFARRFRLLSPISSGWGAVPKAAT